MEVGALVVRACGHEEYLVVEQPSAKKTRSFYTELSSQMCTKCAAKAAGKGGKKR